MIRKNCGERLDEIQLCETFNDEFSSGIESPRRTRLLERLRTVLPAMRDCLLDLKAVTEGERSRYDQAAERMLAQHPELTPMTDDVWDQIDPATAGIWDCCDALTYEGSRECELLWAPEHPHLLPWGRDGNHGRTYPPSGIGGVTDMDWVLPITGIIAMLFLIASMFMDDHHDFIPLLITAVILIPCGILTVG